MALLVAIVIGGLLIATAWLVPSAIEPVREDTAQLREGQEQLLAGNERMIQLLEQEKGIPRAALISHLVRLGADPAIEQAEVPRFLEHFAEDFVTLREKWQAQTGAEIDATREAALALLDEGDLGGARDLLREARQQLRAVRQERALDEAALLADQAAIERLDLRYRDAATLLAEAADLTAFDLRDELGLPPRPRQRTAGPWRRVRRQDRARRGHRHLRAGPRSRPARHPP